MRRAKLLTLPISRQYTFDSNISALAQAVLVDRTMDAGFITAGYMPRRLLVWMTAATIQPSPWLLPLQFCNNSSTRP